VASKIKTLLAAVAAGLTGMLSGCVIGGRTIYYVDDPFLFLAHAAAHGGLAIMVVGDPYPERRDQVNGAVLAAFDRTFASLDHAFRIAEQSADPVSKIVVLFNATNAVSAQTVCADPGKIAFGSAGVRTSVRALYCGDGPYSEYTMSFFILGSPEDETFADMMRQLALNTVPRERNPEQR
jgi:hypothetical protein